MAVHVSASTSSVDRCVRSYLTPLGVTWYSPAKSLSLINSWRSKWTFCVLYTAKGRKSFAIALIALGGLVLLS